MTLVQQLKIYVADVPPHQRDREAANLLVQSLAHIVEAERKLAEALTLNHNLSREVARLNEEMNLNKL